MGHLGISVIEFGKIEPPPAAPAESVPDEPKYAGWSHCPDCHAPLRCDCPNSPPNERAGPRNLAAEAQVCRDLHEALGVPWGHDPYARIKELQANEALIARLGGERDEARKASQANWEALLAADERAVELEAERDRLREELDTRTQQLEIATTLWTALKTKLGADDGEAVLERLDRIPVEAEDRWRDTVIRARTARDEADAVIDAMVSGAVYFRDAPVSAWFAHYEADERKYVGEGETPLLAYRAARAAAARSPAS